MLQSLHNFLQLTVLITSLAAIHPVEVTVRHVRDPMLLP